MNTEELKEHEILIESLNSYFQTIAEIRNKIKEEEGEEGDSKKFFFRGQANKTWDVMPCIFRNNYLTTESEMLNQAFLRNPSDFKNLDTDFEKLAKLQHYGLPTRLLDVTSNPLVALYFACLPHFENGVETDGVVFFQRNYGKGYNELEISVISHLANKDIDGDVTLEALLSELEEKGIYSENATKECRKNNYKSLIDILQNNYFVISNLNNERLIRQSGLFLLVGKYNIVLDEENRGKTFYLQE